VAQEVDRVGDVHGAIVVRVAGLEQTIRSAAAEEAVEREDGVREVDSWRTVKCRTEVSSMTTSSPAFAPFQRSGIVSSRMKRNGTRSSHACAARDEAR